MKTIKAKDAKFGRYYECEWGRTQCAHTPYEGSSPVFMNRFGLARALKPTHEVTELPAECDSFDWQPAADHGFAVGDWVRSSASNDGTTPDEIADVIAVENQDGSSYQWVTWQYENGVVASGYGKHIRKVTFRPFANAAEFEPFRDGWYRINSTGMMFRISHYNDTAVDSHSYDWLLSNCEFASGRPCGVDVAQ